MISAIPLGSVGSGSPFGVLGPAPAAGVDPSITVPAGVRWRILTVSSAFITDATVGNRVTRISMRDPAGLLVLSSLCPRIFAASEFRVLWGFAGLDPVGIDEPGVAGIFNWGAFSQNVYIEGGGVISFGTTGLQPGDGWGGILMAVEQFAIGL